MAQVVYAAPMVPPVIPGSPWVRMPITWTDYTGRVWDMCTGKSGLVLMAGVRGFNMPPINAFEDESPALPGAIRRGWRAGSREVFWPLKVFQDVSAREWVEHDSLFWSTMHPDRPGTWTVESPLGVRRLDAVFRDDGDHATEKLPTLRGWERYGIYLVANSPYWYGDPVRRTWAQSDPVNFFGGGAGTLGPTFHISSASQLATATMTNPGDVDAWPLWTVVGPATSVTVGVGTDTVTAPIVLAEGQELVIDTNPASRSVTVDGVNRYKELTSWKFAPIPAGQSRQLTLALAGTGSVTAEIVPQYLRAW